MIHATNFIYMHAHERDWEEYNYMMYNMSSVHYERDLFEYANTN